MCRLVKYSIKEKACQEKNKKTINTIFATVAKNATVVKVSTVAKLSTVAKVSTVAMIEEQS